MISILDIYVIKWTDKDGTKKEERFPNERTALKKCSELTADGIEFERYKLTTVKSEEVTTVTNPF